MNQISWWRTNFVEDEIEHIVKSFRNECVSQGRVTEEFEQKLSEFFEIEHVVAVSSGSAALTMSLMAVGVQIGDEIILPNRTWIATAHAVHLLGAKVVLVDVEPDRPIMDVSLIEEAVTSNTKAVIPVHMNGRSTDMRAIQRIAEKYDLFVIEDCAQAIASCNSDGYLGLQSDIGCFSLSVTKCLSTGQGGFAVTSNKDLAKKMRAIRTHGIENVKDPKKWLMPGFNFRFNDIQASIGIEQLKRLFERINFLRELYFTFARGLDGSPFKLIPVDIEIGEVPLYSEYLVESRETWIEKLQQCGVETRQFYPNIDTAHYLSKNNSDFSNSQDFAKKGIYLPSGPGQELVDIKRCIGTIKKCKF